MALNPYLTNSYHTKYLGQVLCFMLFLNVYVLILYIHIYNDIRND